MLTRLHVEPAVDNGAMDLKRLTLAKVAPADNMADAGAKPLTGLVLARLVKLLRRELRHERGTTEHLGGGGDEPGACVRPQADGATT